jgi:phospholipid/cholesterol/gamma-HCH transport system substrate-binding protein
VTRRSRLLLPALLATLALLTSSCSLIGGGGDTYSVTVVFSRAVSLYKQSQVKVLGLPAGKVTDIRTEGATIVVDIEMNKDIPIPADAKAAIVPQSLIGERYVQLFPAWTKGDKRLKDGAVIPLERTRVPIEPDQALAALKEFLDTLDPKGVGRLIENAADDLEGNGAQLGDALGGLSDLTATLASKDEALGRIMDQLDEFSATLVTRESQLGEILDLFATTTAVLAEERQNLEGLVKNLASVAEDGVDLVATNAAELQRDLDVLGRTLRMVVANLDSVEQLLDAGPLLVSGLDTAFNPEFRRIDLRNSFSPLVVDALRTVTEPLGIDLGDGFCLPVDVQCEDSGAAAPPVSAPDVTGQAAGGTPVTPAAVAPARTPIDDLVGILDPVGLRAGRPVPAPVRPSTADRIAGAAESTGRFVRDAAASLLGVG